VAAGSRRHLISLLESAVECQYEREFVEEDTRHVCSSELVVRGGGWALVPGCRAPI
jgi:hypothetical protein